MVTATARGTIAFFFCPRRAPVLQARAFAAHEPDITWGLTLNRALQLFFFALTNFGPLIAYGVGQHFYGMKVGIMAATAVSLAEFLRFAIMRQRPPMFFLFSFGITVLFGLIDLLATDPFVFRYESVATSLVFALYFGASVLVGKPVIAEFARQTMDPERMKLPGVRRYLELLTFVWTGYFVVKAGVYFYVARTYSIEEALAFRAVVGNATLAGLLIGERVLRPQIIVVLKRLGILPPTVAADAATSI